MELEGKKRCATCHVWKEPTLDNFHSNGKDGRLRGSCAECYNKRKRGEYITPPKVLPVQSIPKSDKYLVTYAQNATPPHMNTLMSMLNYCHHNKAHLLIVTGKL